METFTNEHHLIPRSKKGKNTAHTCPTCENYIHKTWTNNQLRDTYNTVEAIRADEGFQKFLKWRLKQSPDVVYKSQPGKYRTKHPYH